MAGTKTGGQKAAETNKLRYGKDFYAEIGRKGGSNGHTGGFASSHERAVEAGRKGGAISSRAYDKLPLATRRAAYKASASSDGGKVECKPPAAWKKQFAERVERLREFEKKQKKA